MKFFVLVNGSPVGSFNNSRGLRDPLYPLFFVNIIGALTWLISALVQHGFMAGFLMGASNRGNLNIPHLLYADNTVFL